ncbi:MAG: hypothetical protein WCG81_21550 [Candidatus Angelobacter sp.]
MANILVSKAALVACILTLTLATAQRPVSSYDPAQHRLAKQHDTLIDFVLKHINPADKDYGEWLEQARKSAIDAGLDSLPSLLSGGLLICSFLLIIHQSKERQHRELIASRFLVWYHNELVHARDTAREVIGKNQQWQKIIDENGDAGAALKTAELLSSSRAQSTSKGGQSLAPAAQRKTVADNQDLLTEINKLREKVLVQDASEKTLRQQISQLGRNLQEEKQKNRALKGE